MPHHKSSQINSNVADRDSSTSSPMEDRTSFSRSRTADSGYCDDEGGDVPLIYGEAEALKRSLERSKADAREARQRNVQEEERRRQDANRATYEAIETVYLRRVKARCERQARERAAKPAAVVLKQEEDNYSTRNKNESQDQRR
jgi:hypothetical protein